MTISVTFINDSVNKPIIVSRDGYIIDGHHHWGAMRALRVINKDTKVKAYHVDMSQEDVFRAAQKFTDANDIQREGIAKFARILMRWF